MAVRMKPFGSLLSPGIMNLAITPTIKPMIIVQRMLMSCSCLDPALGANRAPVYTTAGLVRTKDTHRHTGLSAKSVWRTDFVQQVRRRTGPTVGGSTARFGLWRRPKGQGRVQ